MRKKPLSFQFRPRVSPQLSVPQLAVGNCAQLLDSLLAVPAPPALGIHVRERPLHSCLLPHKRAALGQISRPLDRNLRPSEPSALRHTRVVYVAPFALASIQDPC